MKYNVHLSSGAIITLNDVNDFAFDHEDETVIFYHEDTTLAVVPRENVLLIKELAEEATPETIN